VASAGDVNGDGFADLIVGAYRADPNGSTDSGASYVVFGKASGFAANIDLSSLDGTAGFRLSGVGQIDFSGYSVASAGDVNGDGFADLIIGTDEPNPNTTTDSGASYVVFGKASGFAANIDLSSLNGSTGFKPGGQAASD
jgi:FG-GAP repeat